MKLIILWLALAIPCSAQGLFVGVTGGGSFGNLFVGPTAEVRVPINRFEMTVRDTFSPLESHISLGRGYANSAVVEPILWLRPNFGLDARFDASMYHTSISKHDYYAYGGITTRGIWLGAPARMTLDYFREVHNGLYGHGIETSHLQGGSVYIEAQIGCGKHACYYTTLEMNVGTLLEQGNPVCDGSGLPNPQHLPFCQRSRNLSGSGILGFLVEIPKRASR